MTREQIMEELIRKWTPTKPYPDSSPFIGDEWDVLMREHRRDKDRVMMQWVHQASPEWLDRLIELVLEPPDIALYYDQFEELWGEEIDQDAWTYHLVNVLAEWGKHDTNLVLGKIGPLLRQSRGRETLLDVISYMNAPMHFPYKARSLPWIKPLVTQVADLTEGELLNLASAIMSVEGKDALHSLLLIQEAASSSRVELKQTLEKYILNIKGF